LVAVGLTDGEVDERSEDVSAVEYRQVGADPVWRGQGGEQCLDVGLGRLEFVAEAGGDFCAPEPVCGGAAAPAVEQLSEGDVLFGGPGLEHDAVEFAEGGVAADGVLDLPEGVVDVAAPP
jgi:hypothetical protein